MITLEAMGLSNAQGLTDFMVSAISEFGGCYYKGTTREPTDNGVQMTNAEVMNRLAEGTRDLRNMSDSDAEKFGEVWKNEIERAALSFLAKDGGLKKVYQKKEAYELAKIASGRAWKHAGNAVMEVLHRRRSQQLATDANGSEYPAKPVSESYAEWRERKYGVSRDRIYIATGQLMEDLSPDTPGRISLVRGAAAVARSEFASEVNATGRALTNLV